LFCSCKQDKVNGIIIGSDLLFAQDYSENRKLCSLINRALEKDAKAVEEITNMNCGGASGCYDLGYVLTQLITRLGEKEFIKLTIGLSKSTKNSIQGLIMAGLEYGDNEYDGKMDDKRISEVFPNLEKVLE